MNGEPLASTDLGQSLTWLTVNDIALQWASLFMDRDVPAPQLIPGTRIPTQTATQTTTLLVIGAVVVVAIVVLNR